MNSSLQGPTPMWGPFLLVFLGWSSWVLQAPWPTDSILCILLVIMIAPCFFRFFQKGIGKITEWSVGQMFLLELLQDSYHSLPV